MRLTAEQVRQYREQGYLVVPRLFDAGTIDTMLTHYMEMRAQGPKPGDMGGDQKNPSDPLNQFPRMINMHAWDKQSQAWALDKGLLGAVQQLIDDEAVLNQTMLYFKPPKARGQAAHQDQQYITIDPLIGVWVSLDHSDEATGWMECVPGSHKLGMFPVEEADTSKSFTGGQTKLPAHLQAVGLDMQPGDTLFFHGKTIHGSPPNVTSDRWRRCFICHYVGKHAVKFVPEEGTHMSHVGKAQAEPTGAKTGVKPSTKSRAQAR